MLFCQLHSAAQVAPRMWQGSGGYMQGNHLGHQGREDIGGSWGAGGEGTVVSGRQYQRAKGGREGDWRLRRG